MIAWIRARKPRVRALLAALGALVMLLSAWWWGSRWYKEQLLSQYRAWTTAEVSSRAHALSAAIARRFALLQGLHAFVQAEGRNPRFDALFETFAQSLCDDLTEQGLRDIEVAPGGTVRYVYPLQGNESVLGYRPAQDLNHDVRADVQRALDSKQIILSGPDELTQGGIGLIARQAVYVPDQAGEGETYWGLVHVALDLPPLLVETGLDHDIGDLDFALRDGSGRVFFGSPEVFTADPVIRTIPLPEGAWELAASPNSGWQAAVARSSSLFRVSGLLIVGLAVGLTYVGAGRQARLAQVVRQRTGQLSSLNQTLEADIAERERVEAAWRVSETNFRALFEQAPLAIQICDQEGHTLRVNEAYEQLWGCTKEQAVGSNVLEGECPIPQSFMGTVRRAFAGEAAYLPPTRYGPEQVPTIQGGHALWLRTFVYPVRDETDAIRQVIVIHADVTEQKEAEQALRESEERFRGAFEGAAFGMTLVGTDGRLLQVNPSVCNMLGYSRAELLDKTFQELTYPDDLRVGLELFHSLLAGKRDYGWLEKRYIHKDGHPIWAFLSTSVVRGLDGAPLYLVSQMQDITQRKQAEARLMEKEAQYRGIFEATRDGLIISHMDGHIVEANPAACAMYGYRYDELVHLRLEELAQAGYRTRLDEIIDRVKGGEAFVVQAVDKRKDGSTFHVELLVSRFTYSGEPHILSVIRDVTERAQAQQLLEQRVEERTRELSTLLRISRDVASTLDLGPLLASVLDQLGQVVAYDAAAILIMDKEEGVLYLAHREPARREGEPERWDPRQVGHIAEVIDCREPLIIPDVSADTPLAQLWQQAIAEQQGQVPARVASWMGVPLLVKQRLVGMLSLDHSRAGYYTPRHAELALAFANYAAVAIENARLYAQSQRLAVLEERQRIARELHDSVSQALYGIGLGARTARTLLDRGSSRAAEPIEYVLSLAESGLAEMRSLILELRPDSLERGGLVPALENQAAALRSGQKLTVQTILGEEPELSLEGKEALYRIAQEALNNVVRHAQASRVEIRMRSDDDQVKLEVEDNGIGFDPDVGYPGHLGLHSMRERAEAVGATLLIDSAPGQGTRLQVTLPL